MRNLFCLLAASSVGAAGIFSAQGDEMSEPKRYFGLGSVNAASVSNDRRHLATAGESAAYLWDYESGTVRHRLDSHRTMVYAIAFSPDSTRLVTGARFGSVAIWSVNTGRELSMFRAHETDITSIQFSQDGKRFVTASADNTAAIWSTESGEMLQRVRVPGTQINQAALTPDGKQLVTADHNPTRNIRIWDAASGAPILELGEHEGGTLSLAFLEDGTLVTAGMDRKVRLWNLATGESLRTLDGARDGVRFLVPIPGSTLLAAGSMDRTVTVFDWTTGNALHVWQIESPNSLERIPGTETLLSSATDHWVRELDPKTGLTLRAFSGHTTSVTTDVGFSPDGQFVISSGNEKSTRLWNRTNAAPVREFLGSGSGSASAVFSPNGRRVLTTMSFPRRVAQLWNVDTAQVEREFPGHTDWILAATLSQDGSQVATSSMDRTVRVWDAETGAPIRTFSTGGNFMYAIAFSPDGKRVAGGGAVFDPTVQIWDIASGSTQATLSADAGSVRAILFNQAGDEIIVGWDEGLVRRLNLTTGKLVQELFAKGFLNDMALSPDERFLALAEGWPSFTARVVDSQTGEEVRAFTGHASPVGAIAFNARGTQLLSGADVVRLWDLTDLATRLQSRLHPGGLELTWSTGTLMEAPSPSGPWTPVPNAQSPRMVPLDALARFFQVQTDSD